MARFWCSPVRRAQKAKNPAGSPDVALKLALNRGGSCLLHKEFFTFPGLSGRPSEPYDPQAIRNRGTKAKECAPIRGRRAAVAEC
jgi:hypothetical protein